MGATDGAPQGGTHGELMTPAEVAALFRVDPKTVTRWAQQGKLTCVRTLGGHRRFRTNEVQDLLHRSSTEDPTPQTA